MVYSYTQLAFESFHNHKDMVRKYLSTFHIGHLCEEERKVCSRYTAVWFAKTATPLAQLPAELNTIHFLF